MNGSSAPQDVVDLVSKFGVDERYYASTTKNYLEADVRSEFIDPLLQALGWDTANKAAVTPLYRDVVREESQEREDSAAKKPDYTLRHNGKARLYVEAKKPSVNILTHIKSIAQARSYGYTQGHPISVLTNFKELSVYDTSFPVTEDDGPETGRILHWGYADFVNSWESISGILGREAVQGEEWASRFTSTRPQQPATAGEIFVEQLNRWRLELGEDIVRRHVEISEELLNDAVQRILNRLIFIRMCEDRGIEGEAVLRRAFAGEIASVTQLFERLDDRYNTGLFHAAGTEIDLSLEVDSQLMRRIVESLYSPRSTLSFAVLDADFLGLAYEATLAQHLTVKRKAGRVAVNLNSKPEYAKRDVVTTPQALVDTTMSEAIAHLDPTKLTPKVLDFATGSGRFLVSAFDRVLDRYTTSLIGSGSTEIVKTGENEWRLNFETKRNLLTENFYGIDIDYNAVEVARFSLLVRLLQDESAGTLPRGRKILPDLEKNIIHGNTLVRALPDAFEWQIEQTRPLDLATTDLPSEFDLVVGNPPYMKTEEIKSYNRTEYEYLKTYYHLLYKQFDKYMAFVEFAADRLADGGCMGVVIPNKWMTIVAGSKMRDRLRSEVRVVHLANFRHVQLFAARTIYICALVAKKGSESGFDYIEPGSIDQYTPASTAVFPIAADQLPPDHQGAWVLPANQTEHQVLSAISNGSVRLGSVVTARNGIQTSKDAVYVIEDPVVRGNKVLYSKNGKKWQIELALTRPYLDDSTGVQSYHLVQADSKVIFPYRPTQSDAATSGYELIPLRVMKAKFPLALAYLRHSRKAISNRDMGVSVPADFYAYGRIQAIGYCTEKPKIFYSVNQTGNKYGLDEDGIVYSSGGTAGEVALYPQNENISLDFVLALLDQRPIEFFIHKRGSAFRGGYFARGSDVIADVPTPKLDFHNADDVEFHDAAASAMKALRELHSMLPGLAARYRTQHEAKIAAAKKRMDALFMKRWGLTEDDYSQVRL